MNGLELSVKVICVVVAIYISLRIQYTINKADDFIERCGKLMGSVMTNRCCVRYVFVYNT